MAYTRKTQDVYLIESYYPGVGWSEECSEFTLSEAKEQVKCYRDNCPSMVFRIRKTRIRKEIV